MKDNLVFTSAGDNTNFYKHWCGNSKDYDLWVTYYGDDEKKYKLYSKHSDYITKRKGFKFQNFYDLYNSKDLSQYERIFILDDDIIISTEDINKMFIISKKFNLSICGPTFKPNCKISHPKTINNPKWFMRYTNYVEVNVPLFSKEALRRLMDVFDPKLVGWGIDRLAAWANGYKNIALVDDVICINPHDRVKGGVRELTKGDESWAIREEIWYEVAKRYKITRKAMICNKSFVSKEEGNHIMDSKAFDETVNFKSNKKDKIAILMLGYETFNYPNVWVDFLEDGKDRCTFYTHIKHKDKCKTKILIDNHIKKHIPTKWGDISLVKATNNMLEEAYKNETNKIFILTSADTVPLYDFNKIYNDTINTKKSWLSIIQKKENRVECSQFFLLTRDHVKLVLENRDKEDTYDMPKTVPDESYYYDLLSKLDKDNIINKKILEFKIHRNHRCVSNSLNETSLKVKRKKGAYFFRKVEPNKSYITYNYLKQRL